MKKSTKKGFTLVELVIVIAVIAILAAVLIPTFSNVVKNANISADLQKLASELEIKFVDYVAEYNKAPTCLTTDGGVNFGTAPTDTTAYNTAVVVKGERSGEAFIVKLDVAHGTYTLVDAKVSFGEAASGLTVFSDTSYSYTAWETSANESIRVLESTANS